MSTTIIEGGQKYDPKKEGPRGFYNRKRDFYFDWVCPNPECSEFGEFVDGCGLVLPAKVIVSCGVCGTQEEFTFDEQGYNKDVEVHEVKIKLPA